MTEPAVAPDAVTDLDRGSTAGVSRWQKVVGGIGLVVVLWVGSEIYDTVSATGPGPGGDNGPGGPVPGQDAPDEPGQEIDPEDEHDPTQFDHG